MWGLGHPWPRRQDSEQQVGERQLRYRGDGKRVAAAQVRAHEAKRVVAAQSHRTRSYCTWWLAPRVCVVHMGRNVATPLATCLSGHMAAHVQSD